MDKELIKKYALKNMNSGEQLNLNVDERIEKLKKENYKLVQEALTKAGRSDLIGFGPECLIKPERRIQNGS